MDMEKQQKVPWPFTEPFFERLPESRVDSRGIEFMVKPRDVAVLPAQVGCLYLAVALAVAPIVFACLMLTKCLPETRIVIATEHWLYLPFYLGLYLVLLVGMVGWAYLGVRFFLWGVIIDIIEDILFVRRLDVDPFRHELVFRTLLFRLFAVRLRIVTNSQIRCVRSSRRFIGVDRDEYDQWSVEIELHNEPTITIVSQAYNEMTDAAMKFSRMLEVPLERHAVEGPLTESREILD